MKVSIVIPCFNHARFVAEAAASGVSQDWPDVEVIVVDDGSTDGSAEAARRAGRHVRVIQQPNRGLSQARNAGIAAARGDVLIFLDADDRLRPHAARVAVAALETLPSAAMAFGHCQLIDAEGQPLATPVPHVDGRFFDELLGRNYIWTPAVAAFRRWTFERLGGFDSRVNPSADYDLYLRVAWRYPLVAHGITVADYRQHGANMSSDPALMLRSTRAVLERWRATCLASPRFRDKYRDGLAGWRRFYGEQLVASFRASLHRGDRAAAVRSAFALLRYYPRGVREQLVKKLTQAWQSARRRSLPPSAVPRSHPAAGA